MERVTSPKLNLKISYDPVTGSVSKIAANNRVNRRFWFDARGKMVQMINVGLDGIARRTSLQYDHLGRLVAMIEVIANQPFSKVVSQFFYADVRHPNRVTHVRSPRAGLTQRLLYDTDGHLVAIDTNDQKLHVATDQVGTPIVIFSNDGTINKEVKYSPFGNVVKDSSPNMRLPIGFRGGLVLSGGNTLTMISGRVYDSEIAQWLNPDWESLQNKFVSPSALFVYRFYNNDPVNRMDKLITYESASNLNHWAKLYGYDMDRIMLTGSNIVNPGRDVIDHFKIGDGQNRLLASGLDHALASAKKNIEEMSFVQKPDGSRDKRLLILNPSIASRSSAFGSGFLLSVTSNSRSMANVIEGAPGVIQGIFSSLLNGSKALDDISYLDTSKKSVYYFAKRYGTASDVAEAFLSSDMDTVNRLAGQYEVNVRPLDRGKDLIIDNDSLELHVLYSDTATINKFVHGVLESGAQEAMIKAWVREKNLVTEGFTGYGDWTANKQAELLAMRPPNKVGVRGFEAVEIQPHLRYPHLVRDESNYGFVSDKHRRNRHGKSRKYGS